MGFAGARHALASFHFGYGSVDHLEDRRKILRMA
jgi:hypothetical protein